MKKNLAVFFTLAGIIILAIIAFLIWGLPYFLDTSLPVPTNNGFGSETVPANILQVIDQGTINLGGVTQPYQDLSVIILSGQNKGLVANVTYGKDQIMPAGVLFHPGDQIMVEVRREGADNSDLIVYSRSVYGESDFGVNRKRIEAWLTELRTKLPLTSER